VNQGRVGVRWIVTNVRGNNVKIAVRWRRKPRWAFTTPGR
jgi:hypothetical protein